MQSWGDPPWQARPFLSRPAEDSSPEVAIIGGGLTGVSAAYHLARRGIHTVLVEAQRLGQGASGRTGGIVLEGTAKGILGGTDRCIAGLERLIEKEKIACDLKLPGCWEIAHRQRGDADALPLADEGCALSVERTVAGGTLDPLALLIGLARAAAEAGAIFHENATVQRLVVSPRPFLELDGAVIRPRFAVVAVNAWTTSLLPNMPPTRSALTFACATDPLGTGTLEILGLSAGIPFYTVDLPYLWSRPMRDGRLIFGAGLTFGSPRQLERIDLGTADQKAALTRLETRVRNLHPALRSIGFSNRWAGPIAIPEALTPFLGPLPGAPAVLVAGGYAGHGVALSVWAGRMMAETVFSGDALPAWARVADYRQP